MSARAPAREGPRDDIDVSHFRHLPLPAPHGAIAAAATDLFHSKGQKANGGGGGQGGDGWGGGGVPAAAHDGGPPLLSNDAVETSRNAPVQIYPFDNDAYVPPGK